MIRGSSTAWSRTRRTSSTSPAASNISLTRSNQRSRSKTIFLTNDVIAKPVLAPLYERGALRFGVTALASPHLIFFCSFQVAESGLAREVRHDFLVEPGQVLEIAGAAWASQDHGEPVGARGLQLMED